MNGTIRGIDETQKVQTFNATLSLCDTYPLLLHEQVSPIVDLMALNNSHFKKLKEFITLQLPSGFPVKIGKLYLYKTYPSNSASLINSLINYNEEIPLYRVITAKVTFGNINALDHPVENVTAIKSPTKMPRDRSVETNLNHKSSGSETSLLSNQSDSAAMSQLALNTTCMVDEVIFKIPSNYKCTNYYGTSSASELTIDRGGSGAAAIASSGGGGRHAHHYGGQPIDDDDILLQLAIQQSLSATSDPNSVGEDDNEANLTAMEVLAGNRQQRGSGRIDCRCFI